uniref:Uncharacterized protein n=1 Tax=Anguilla anguilla TaxID=7936 RepID=A0A0E9T954_ANGAN
MIKGRKKTFGFLNILHIISFAAVLSAVAQIVIFTNKKENENIQQPRKPQLRLKCSSLV